MTDFLNSFDKGTYDMVFSIGAACSCSSALRASGLQLRSLPFDWVYGVSLEERAQMFCNSFCDWLPEKAMSCIGEQLIESIPKMVYENTVTGMVFNHDFPLNESFEKSYPVVKARYERRISRLFDMIRKSRRVLVVHLATPNATNDYSDEYLIRARNYIGDCFPGVTVHLLHLFNDNNVSLDNAVVKSPAPGILTARFCYNAFNSERPHAADIKLLCKFFRRVQVSNKHLTFFDLMNKWSARHRILNHIVRFRLSSNGKQILEIFRIKICSFKVKAN